MANRYRMLALVVLSLLLEVAFLALAREPGTPFFPFLTWMIAAGIFYLIAVGWVLRGRAGAGSKRELRFLLLAAIVFRLTLLPLTPTLSHELGRSQWDGKIQHDGFNPYQYPPQSALFSPIRPTTDQHLASPAIAAYHPPLAELLFRWDFNLFGGLRRQKLLYIALDVLLLGLLVRMLKVRGQPPEWVMIYAWSPLAVFEVAGNGHLAPAAALLALLALHWAGRRRRRAAVAIASAGLTQWYALALAPVVLAAARRRWVGALAWLASWSVLLFLPFLWMNKHFALGVIARNVRIHAASTPPFNGSVFAVVQSWFGMHAALALAVAVVGAVMISTAVQRLEPLRAGFLIVGALLLVMPQMQPWYLLWLLPLVVFWPEAPWLYFSVAVGLAYALPQHPWLVWVEYVPLFGLLLWQSRSLWRPKRAA